MENKSSETLKDPSEMSPTEIDKLVQENLAKWSSGPNPLAPLSDEELDIIYQMQEILRQKYFTPKPDSVKTKEKKQKRINTLAEFAERFVAAELQIEEENMYEFTQHCNYLKMQLAESQNLVSDVNKIQENLKELGLKYDKVSNKISSLYHVSEQLMKQQAMLKSKKDEIRSRLKHFTAYDVLSNTIARSSSYNSKEFLNILDEINTSLAYLKEHPEYKESYKYQLMYDQLLSATLSNIVKYVNNIITDATSQVLNMDLKTNVKLVDNETTADTAFSLYYGKFLNAALKTSNIINYVEDKVELNESYDRSLSDFQRSYFQQRVPVLQAAVSKALLDLRDKYKGDHSILFRSAGLFIIKVCQDEVDCYKYFFKNTSQQLNDYLYSIAQNLYDVLRPCLISINHIEVLTELCTILKEMIGEQVQNNSALDQFVDIINQLLEDVEERLVFRTNIFFHYDLNAYEPSPGDLAYPEKLEQMEQVVEELIERRPDSRSSSVSAESREVAAINASTVGQFRSFTGNSPADLHGMWYPTVKRTLVCLSRLYICLDRQTFQGVAQEALLICVKTIEKAAEKIIERKTALDGRLFQIKHLLIIREQIAPFQADFSVKEMSLDFSNVKNAAIGLVHNRKNIFSLSSNNALLEFLLEGTPRVKEYLVDSRKEIDKQLKSSCEAFISNTTNLLVGDLIKILQKAEPLLGNPELARKQLPAQTLAEMVKVAQRNIKSKVPDIHKFMRLYLANRETEFILFRPIKNNLINAFIRTEQFMAAVKYTSDECLLVACPTAEQLNVLISSVSLSADQEHILMSKNASTSRQQN